MENKVKEFRESKGLSQEELAEIIGITRPYLSSIETQKRNPNGIVLLKIAKALGKRVEEIFLI